MTLILGKCEEKLLELDNESVDFCLFSPPYDQIRDYNSYSLNLHDVGLRLFDVMKNGSVTCIIIQDGTKDFAKSTTTAHLIVDWVDNIGFRLFENVIYSRDGRPGAWWNKRFRVDHEYILMFLKGRRPKYFDKEHLKIPAKHAGEVWHGTQRLTNGNLIPIKKTVQKNTKCRGTIWKYESSKSERNSIKLQHPATFPDMLARDLILTFSQENETVLDPMCGSGTTLRMAQESNRKYIGIDISKEYLDIAENLLNL